jgi:hypothetical protein
MQQQQVSPAKLKKVTEILGRMRARRDSLAAEDTAAIPSSHVDHFISEVPKKQPTLLFMADTTPTSRRQSLTLMCSVGFHMGKMAKDCRIGLWQLCTISYTAAAMATISRISMYDPRISIH